MEGGPPVTDVGPDEPGLGWRDGRTPFSERFGETYYSEDGGLEESRLVFLEGCGLPDAWQGRRRFTIAETGFGTGLNFLAVWDLWRRTAPPGSVLHYLSVEGYPLSRSSLQAALAPWPELAGQAAALVAAWPEPPAYGFHRLIFETDRVFLTLLVGEASEMLAEAEAHVDAWFLDGFSPARNPEMWGEVVLREVARLSVPGARLATFTVAGAVRRGLSEVGFEVEKRPGFGRKRDRLVATYVGTRVPARWPKEATAHPLPSARRIGIVGAGIAGASLAQALRRRGVDAVIFDAIGRPRAASGNPVAVIMPKVDLGDGPGSVFLSSAYRHAVRTLPRAADVAAGAVSLARTEKEANRFRNFAARVGTVSWGEADRLSAAAGLSLGHPGLIFGDARTVASGPLIDGLLAGSEVVETDGFVGLGADPVASLAAVAGGGDSGSLDALVVAAGSMTIRALKPLLNPAGDQSGVAAPPLFETPGQLTGLPSSRESRPLRCVVSFGGYVTPAVEGVHHLGATYEHDVEEIAAPDGTLPLRVEGQRRNLAGLASMLPFWRYDPDWVPPIGRRSIRCTTPDRLPVGGHVGEWLRKTGFQSVAKGGSAPAPGTAPIPMFVVSGLGSRGFSTAGLLAEILCAEWFEEPYPVPWQAVLAVHPNRFIWRRSRQGRDRRQSDF